MPWVKFIALHPRVSQVHCYAICLIACVHRKMHLVLYLHTGYMEIRESKSPGSRSTRLCPSVYMCPRICGLESFSPLQLLYLHLSTFFSPTSCVKFEAKLKRLIFIRFFYWSKRKSDPQLLYSYLLLFYFTSLASISRMLHLVTKRRDELLVE